MIGTKSWWHVTWAERYDHLSSLLACYYGDGRISINLLCVTALFIYQALWLHRRFLSLTWIMHFERNQSSETGQRMVMNEEIVTFIDKEIHLLESSMTVPDTKFEDFQAQALHAAVYMLWLTKVSIGLFLSKIDLRAYFVMIH